MEQQEHSSPQGTLPLGVDPSELYDGPKLNGQLPPGPPSTAQVQQAPVQPPRQMQQQTVDPRRLVAAIPPQQRQVTSSADRSADILSLALHMVAARVFGIIALLAACAIWGYTVFDPLTQRTIAATIFSVTVLLPSIMLYWREYWKTK